jgi:hypothetical protein
VELKTAKAPRSPIALRGTSIAAVRILKRLGMEHVDNLRLATACASHIARVLDACDGNKSLAARLLGINRRTLQRLGWKLNSFHPAEGKRGQDAVPELAVPSPIASVRADAPVLTFGRSRNSRSPAVLALELAGLVLVTALVEQSGGRAPFDCKRKVADVLERRVRPRLGKSFERLGSNAQRANGRRRRATWQSEVRKPTPDPGPVSGQRSALDELADWFSRIDKGETPCAATEPVVDSQKSSAASGE